MANFSRAEISSRPPEQLNLLKRTFVIRGETFSPGLNSEKPHVIEFKFQPGLKSELGHAR